MGCGFMRTRCNGPNGLETETIQQMLELLGADPPAGMPWLKPSERFPPVAEETKPQSQSQPAETANEGLVSISPAIEQTKAKCDPNDGVGPHEAQIVTVARESVSEEKAREREKLKRSKKECKLEVNVAREPEYDDYEDEEEEDESRPQAITSEDIARIDQMSPNELNALIEDVDAHEEWEELRREAKQRIEFWEGGLKIAHQSPRCGYIKNNGKPCGSPAMKDDSFCYFHSQASVQRDSVAAAGGLELPALDDRLGVQLAIMRVCGMLVDKSLDEKTGRAVLVGLRLAQKNLGHADALFGPNDLD